VRGYIVVVCDLIMSRSVDRFCGVMQRRLVRLWSHSQQRQLEGCLDGLAWGMAADGREGGCTAARLHGWARITPEMANMRGLAGWLWFGEASATGVCLLCCFFCGWLSSAYE